MPTTRILVPPTPEAEPVTLALASAAIRPDLELGSTDPAQVGQRDYLQLLLSAAREKVEAYTGRCYAAQTVELTYTLDEVYALPAGATVSAVSGFYTTLEALADAVAYMSEYQKGISINRELDWPYPALSQTYTVTVALVPDPSFLALAKTTILELAGEWYKNRETTVSGYVVAELPVNWKVKLRPAVINVLGAY